MCLCEGASLRLQHCDVKRDDQGMIGGVRAEICPLLVCGMVWCGLLNVRNSGDLLFLLCDT